MHPFSILTLGIFVAGYITARWDLVTRLYELARFAWNHGVVVRFTFVPCLLVSNMQRLTLVCTRPELPRDLRCFRSCSSFSLYQLNGSLRERRLW